MCAGPVAGFLRLQWLPFFYAHIRAEEDGIAWNCEVFNDKYQEMLRETALDLDAISFPAEALKGVKECELAARAFQSLSEYAKIRLNDFDTEFSTEYKSALQKAVMG